MRNNTNPDQITLFNFINDGNIVAGGGAKIHSFHDITSFDNIVSAWQRFSHDKQKKQDVIEFKLRYRLIKVCCLMETPIN